MAYFVGLDVGTSGVKALAVGRNGQVAAQALAPLSLSHPQPGWAEQNPSAWWKASLAALAGLRRKLGAAKTKQIAAIGLSGQMHSSVFLDKNNKVIRPALLWCDGRTTEQCRQITRRAGEKNLRAWVGNPALEGFTLPKVLWLKQHEPAAFRRLAKVVMPKDYIRFRLTGSLAAEPSDASGTLMYDVRRRRWSDSIMKSVGLKTSLLADLGASHEALGKLSAAVARLTGLPEGIAVAGGGADNACGAVGVGLVGPGEAVASWGTSGTVLSVTKRPKVDPGMRAHTFCHAVPDRWYVMGVMLTAGAAFAWHRDQFGRELPARDRALALNREAASVAPGAEGLTFLPYMQGERTPHRDAAARGSLVGLTLSHQRAHVSRAVLEGVCFGLKDSVEILRAMKLPLRRVLLTGGGAKAPLVRKMQTDIYGLATQRVNREEGPAYGAALLGGVAAGAWRNVEAACNATLKRTAPLKPDRRLRKAYDRAYSKFKNLYPALQGHF